MREPALTAALLARAVLESLRLRQPDVTSQIPFYEEGQPPAGPALANLLSTKGGRRTVKSWGKAKFDKLQKAAILAEESKPSIDDTIAEFTLDAFFFGNVRLPLLSPSRRSR